MLRQFFLFMYMHLESTAILVKVEIYRFVFFSDGGIIYLRIDFLVEMKKVVCDCLLRV